MQVDFISSFSNKYVFFDPINLQNYLHEYFSVYFKTTPSRKLTRKSRLGVTIDKSSIKSQIHCLPKESFWFDDANKMIFYDELIQSHAYLRRKKILFVFNTDFFKWKDKNVNKSNAKMKSST